MVPPDVDVSAMTSRGRYAASLAVGGLEGEMQIRHAIEIARPPEDVFDFLADTDSFRVVDRALVSYTPHGVLHVGLSGTFVHRRGGMTARSTWTVAELERPSRLAVALRGMGYEMEEAVTLVANGTGTHATFVETVRPISMGGRVMVALSTGIMRRDLTRRAALLRSTLEA
jgi:hypothetical protein